MNSKTENNEKNVSREVVIPDSYVFILNIIKTDIDRAIEIIPNHYFRKAVVNEINIIKDVLKFYGCNGIGMLTPDILPYENDWLLGEKNKKRFMRKVPFEESRFYVISFKGNNTEIQTLEAACKLIKDHLDLGFTVLGNCKEGSRGFIFPPAGQILYKQHTDVVTWKAPTIIKQEDIKQISEYYDLMKSIHGQYSFLDKAIKKYLALDNISPNSDLLVLGYFSIIESLITHAPRGNETLDSINHQIVNKMILLRKRFVRSLDYYEYFKEDKEEAIWKKLYKYRSCLAHGSTPHFDKDLMVLENKDKVFMFVLEALKLLIIASLKEPVLISDLRNC